MTEEEARNSLFQLHFEYMSHPPKERLDLYEKYKTIKAPILMHIFLNTTIILTMPLILKNYLVFNLYLLIVSIFILIVIKKQLK